MVRPMLPSNRRPKCRFLAAQSGRRWTSFWIGDAHHVVHAPGIYALYARGVLVYIGQTSDLKARLMDHRRYSPPCEMVKACVVVNEPERCRFEERLIRRLQPVRNVQYTVRQSPVRKRRRKITWEQSSMGGSLRTNAGQGALA